MFDWSIVILEKFILVSSTGVTSHYLIHHPTEQQQKAQNVKNLLSVQKVDSRSPLIPTQSPLILTNYIDTEIRELFLGVLH